MITHLGFDFTFYFM